MSEDPEEVLEDISNTVKTAMKRLEELSKEAKDKKDKYLPAAIDEQMVKVYTAMRVVTEKVAAEPTLDKQRDLAKKLLPDVDKLIKTIISDAEAELSKSVNPEGGRRRRKSRKSRKSRRQTRRRRTIKSIYTK
jgi:hypothetical protein